MSQTTFPCTCCGNTLIYEEDVMLRDCPACGTQNPRPRVTGETLATLQRATEQRVACDFHNAELSYQQVLLYRPDAYEALWGRLLCHYGVEYVEDPASHRRMPTVHTVRPKPLQSQPDFIKACHLAPEAARRQYEQDAAYIDEAQANIRRLAAACQPYDVFLCHKTTKPGSMEKTRDYEYAQELYYELEKQGLRVFFAPKCLQTAAGANYEAGIYHALHTAKVMLLVCTDAEYLTSAWVRSEWSRFLSILEEEEASAGHPSSKRIIPLLYDHFSAYDLPQQFVALSIQGIDMSGFNASQNLLSVVSETVGRRGQEEPKPHKPVPAPTPAPAEKPVAVPVEKPAPQPVKSGYSVSLTFPGLRPHWTDVPEWYVVAADKKTVLADVKWNSTVQVPIDSARTQLFCVQGTPDPEEMEKAKRASRIWGGLLAAACVVSLVAAICMANANYSTEDTFLFLYLLTCLLVIGVAVAGGKKTLAATMTTWTRQGVKLIGYKALKTEKGLTVTAGKHYDLTWPWGKNNNQFNVSER